MFFKNKFRKIWHDKRGVSLLVVLGTLAVLIILSTGVARIVLSFVRSASQIEQANIAFLAAESGVELALYDLSAFEDGYQTDQNSNKKACENGVNLGRTAYFDKTCNDGHPYRFVNFTDSDLSGGRGFWRLFARTLKNRDNNYHVIPNPYFVGNGDGRLIADEWSSLTKSIPISFSLLIDKKPEVPNFPPDPDERFTWLKDGNNVKIIFWADGEWDDNKCVDIEPDSTCDRNGKPIVLGDEEEEIFTWLFSAIDGSGEEYTLQGVANESDFSNSDDYDGDGTNDFGFVFDLTVNSAIPNATSGDVFAGEDINQNLPSHINSGTDKFNRVSGIKESAGFYYEPPKKFLKDLDDAMNKSSVDDQWHEASLTFNLIGTLSETSGIDSNALKYKIVSDVEQLADNSTYIISEGFAGNIKQTIQTKFVRESAIPIFSYVIFQ